MMVLFLILFGFTILIGVIGLIRYQRHPKTEQIRMQKYMGRAEKWGGEQ